MNALADGHCQPEITSNVGRSWDIVIGRCSASRDAVPRKSHQWRCWWGSMSNSQKALMVARNNKPASRSTR
jgi:hypothetical protein